MISDAIISNTNSGSNFEKNYLSTRKELNFNIGYNFSPYLGIASGFKRGVMDYNLQQVDGQSSESKLEDTYYGTTISIMGKTPSLNGLAFFGSLDIGRVVIESEDTISQRIIGLYMSKIFGIAYTPKPWFALSLGYNTQTVDVSIVNSVFSGQLGLNVIEGLQLDFRLEF